MSYWFEIQAREKYGDRLREAREWRLLRAAGRPGRHPTRPQGRGPLAHLRRSS